MQVFLSLTIGLLLLLLLDRYAYAGFRPLIASVPQQGRRRVWRGLYLSSTALMLGAFLFGMIAFLQRDSDLYRPVTYAFAILVLTFVPKLLLLILWLSEDVVRGSIGLGRWVARMVGGQKAGTEKPPLVPSRRRFLGQAGVLVGGSPFLSILYGITRGKYDFRVRKLTLDLPNLPEAFDGFRLLQLSDIHSGSFDDAEAVARGVALAQAQGADLIVFTGDLVNNIADEIEPWVETFAQLSAPFGVYSTTGNHDYGEYSSWPSEEAKKANFQRLLAAHGRMGWRLLMNEHVKLEKDGQSIDLAGVENWGLPPFPQAGDLNRALDGAESPFRILLSHDPSHWDEQVRQHPAGVDLTLSGHTHGMQFGVEIPGWKWSPVKYRYPRWAGLYEEAGRYLYVNRGFGFIGFPGRVGIWPEITVLTLRRKA
ncbi:MAG: metallophosphoesterase [Bacteroidetes bacterium]|nr:MAG: metallophosphoesterase [Bacteroidota bacterium]